MTVYGGIGAHLRYRLTETAAVTALVSTRIYPGIVPQRSSFPAVIYNEVTAARTHVMGADSGTVESTWQIDSYGQTYQAAREVATKVRQSLSRFTGWLPVQVLTPFVVERDNDQIQTRAGDDVVMREPIASRQIQGIFVNRDRDLFEDETQLFRVTTDYTVWYDETGE
jgi:hypothetical protein